ncbi:hypothetical protein [Arenimonas oryziterrae]|uniref:Uncharacterized protein n=1 Tax=Arenimonas oryziterrae DSM 21050 = YC6267 TaxID=1121015 RepID=A0A091AUB6_9GAMM|nr:hypothetical protein [Arenimonas oryziterrae]KFN42822.1 hypothetical protein N789_11875 [Arenimonas oryziterrae DSM 21050 = YC6267]
MRKANPTWKKLKARLVSAWHVLRGRKPALGHSPFARSGSTLGETFPSSAWSATPMRNEWKTSQLHGSVTRSSPTSFRSSR